MASDTKNELRGRYQEIRHEFSYPSISANDSNAAINQQSARNYYAIIRNIPKNFHCKDLRAYFSTEVENGYFDCFHYRHRPEIKELPTDGEDRKAMEMSKGRSNEACCCMIRFVSFGQRHRFIDIYHLKHWIDARENMLRSLCYVFPVKISSSMESDYKSVSVSQLSLMKEFRPPTVVPKGNVGTSTVYLMQLINDCKLPPSFIKRMSLCNVTSRRRRYGAVYFDYGTEIPASLSHHVSRSDFYPTNFYQNYVSSSKSLSTYIKGAGEDGQPDFTCIEIDEEYVDDDEDDCEDWERHEALNEDVTEQERIKPKKYEQEMEVTWEKGGPGLVWHMDNFTWNQMEEGTDCDWKWADSWDVDYSIYDKDSAQLSSTNSFRSNSVFTNSRERKAAAWNDRKKKGREKIIESWLDNSAPEGFFERHTRHMGSDLMKKCGWRPGQGLGRNHNAPASSHFLDMFEQSSNYTVNERSGLGYYGSRLQRKFQNIPAAGHTIQTIYDTVEDREQHRYEPVLPSRY